jgi:Ca2+-binding EF-hand superfamily protein
LPFNQVDNNKNGFISPRETRKGIKLPGQHITGISFHQIDKKFHHNGDGKLSLQEFFNNIQKSLSEIN